MSTMDDIKTALNMLVKARNELSEALQKDKSRNRGAIVRELHHLSNMLGEGLTYFSQAGQDRVVDAILGQKTGGVFVDVGGYDGVRGSNTLFFEVFRNWTGVLVEPSPTQLGVAKSFRRCPCLPYAVAGVSGPGEFMEVTKGYTQMSGFLDSYDPDLLARVRGDARHEEVIHTMERRRLDDILREADIQQVDFLSLDVEGGEMEILGDFPFEDFDITLLSVENNAQSSDLPELMRDKGYELVEFAGVDDLFRKRQPSA